MAELEGHKRHFVLGGSAVTEAFLSPRRGGGGSGIPERNRREHGQALLHQVTELSARMADAHQVQQNAGVQDGFGLRVAFESFPAVELVIDSIARERSGIELFNVQQESDQTIATVFVPDGKLDVFENVIRAYLEKDTRTGQPKHRKLVDAISEIREAAFGDLWTDAPEAMPASDDEIFWWEVWLPTRGDRTATTQQFLDLAHRLGFQSAPGELKFPERTVMLLRGSAKQMKQSVMVLNSIAELRRAKETAEFFDSLLPREQPAWVDELIHRTAYATDGDDVPYVCLLDTGVNWGHPLLAPAMAQSDAYTVEPGWGVDDRNGHGTNMAGLALFGNLTGTLASSNPLAIDHRLESVKLLPKDGANGDTDQLHGYLTLQAVARVEISASAHRRMFSMAVTAKDGRDRGRPSAWSATLDRLTSDAVNQGELPRLFVVSAGNVSDRGAWSQYPTSNSTDGIHDPAQSWNALTVGAVTHLDQITDPNTTDYHAIANDGGLSPFSTTSVPWGTRWPLKPDVVFEGGNVAQDPAGTAWTVGSLQLLTTHRDPQSRLFDLTNATSAASAIAARMSARLMATYPDLWPESIRALIVHSAEWTNDMRKMFLPTVGAPSKADMVHLVRHCGFGEPDLSRAMWSASNSLTMICEDRLHPFHEDDSHRVTLGEMNLHQLPWPLNELTSLENTVVEMRVTLSYFIEPNPSDRGKSKYRYESHGLRFDVKRPTESESDFRARINAFARADEADGTPSSGDSEWLIGTNSRHKGSLHTDIWSGPAADLASRGMIAVYPTTGWWKTRSRLGCANRMARYSLLVSIRTPATDVDLYSAVANKVATPVQIVV